MRKDIHLFRKSSIALGLLIAIGTTACSNLDDKYDPNYENAQKGEEYNNQWTTKVGSIDPNQTWNMFTSRKVTVTIDLGTTKQYTIKVYGTNPGYGSNTGELIATANAAGGTTTTFNVDLPTAKDTIYVGCADASGMSMIRAAAINSSAFAVNFGGDSDTGATRSVTQTTANTEFPVSVIDNLVKALPEGTGTKAAASLNNYEFVSTGRDFIVNPVYAVTGSTLGDVVGYYYYNPETETAAQAVSKGQYRTLIANTNNLNGSIQLYYTSALNQTTNQSVSPFVGNYVVTSNSNTYFTSKNMTFTQDGATFTTSSLPTKLYSKAFTISEPAGTHIIFCVRNLDDKNATHIYCSNQSLNYDKRIHSAVVKSGDYTFVGLEDWSSGSDFDCNDVSFAVKGAEPVVITNDTNVNYTFAFEDLGSTDDYDFNDVVFDVSYTQKITTTDGKESGRNATFNGAWLMAAGGILPIHVFYKNSDTASAIDLFGEVHEAFKVSQSTMVNTTSFGTTPVKSTTLTTLPALFNISESSSAAGFYIQVTNTTGTTTTVNLPNGKELGIAPQGLVLYGNWAWPTEKTNITTAYPSFGQWGANINSNTNWYNNPASGKTITNTVPTNE